MVDSEGVLRTISWRDLCPWTLLFRVFRLSVSLQTLSLALAGTVLCSLGWWLVGTVTLSTASRETPAVEQFQKHVVAWPDRHSFSAGLLDLPLAGEAAPAAKPSVPAAAPAAKPSMPAAAPAAKPSVPAAAPASEPSVPAAAAPSASDGVAPGAAAAAALLASPPLVVDGPVAAAWHRLASRTPVYAMIEPMRRGLSPGQPWDQRVYYLLGSLWSILVWSLFGGAIARIAAMRLGRDERVGLREALDFARRKLLSYLGAPLLPLGGILVLMIPLALLGLLMRWNLGVALAGLLWLPLGLLGLMIAVMSVGLACAWPLMWATISTEGSDAFDGISRAYAYTYQRPLKYLAYFLLSAVLGFLGWLAVDLFCETIIRFLYLGVGAGSGLKRIEEIRSVLAAGSATDSTTLRFGANLISSFNRLFRGCLTAYTFSYLWSAGTGIYLLLRLDADRAELDDVYFEEEEAASFGLPPITTEEEPSPEGAAE